MKIEVTQNPDSKDLHVISQGLQFHNAKFIGGIAVEDELKFSVFAKDVAGTVVGGIRAVAFWNWLNIEVIWVDEKIRGTGVGRKLLNKAEEYAIKNNFFFASLETTSFQAREFYEKQGYEVFGKLADYPKGYTMFYMKKVLVK